MSVDTIFYCVYGIKLDFDTVRDSFVLAKYKEMAEDLSQKHYEDYELEEKFTCGLPGTETCIVLDGMCGEYAVVGKEIARFELYGNDSDFVNVPFDTLEQSRAKCIAEIKENIPELLPHVDVPWNVIAFIHYS